MELEKKWQPWGLWEPYFGLDQDHDFTLLSDFPLLLSLLCVAFSQSAHAQYFSGKLQKIMEKSGKFDHMSSHGFYWLLIASKIAKDKHSYDYARSVINANGGLNSSRFCSPTVWAGEEYDEENEEKIQVPSFEDWLQFLKTVNYNKSKIDFLRAVIESFLFMDRWEDARKQFALFCIQQSL